MVEKLGEEWVSNWWHGLPGAYDTPTGKIDIPSHPFEQLTVYRTWWRYVLL